jgi:hypothetical protein
MANNLAATVKELASVMVEQINASNNKEETEKTLVLNYSGCVIKEAVEIAKNNLSMDDKEILKVISKIGHDILQRTSRMVAKENMDNVRVATELFQKMAYTLITDVLVVTQNKDLQKIADKTIDLLQKETEEIIELTLHSAIGDYKGK